MNSSQHNQSPAADAHSNDFTAAASPYFHPVNPEHAQLLVSLQQTLEHYYDVDPPYCISEFVCHSAQTSTGSAGCKGTAPEMLVYREDGTNLDISLFLNPSLLTNLDYKNYKSQWFAEGFDKGCILLEGVSHFLYMVFNAHHDRQVSLLDLELQAEIDKFVFAVLDTEYNDEQEQLLKRLFCHVSYRDELSDELKQRYEQANNLAHTYCQWLCRKFILHRKNRRLAAELAQIYRLNGSAKLQYIRQISTDKKRPGYPLI